MPEAISVAEHRAQVLAAVRRLPATLVPLDQARGLVLAEDVHSPIQLPPFDNSAMDGYAVRAADVARTPVTLPVVAALGAGQGSLDELSAGAVAKIMTGAPVPPGADAVVPYEDTDRGAASVEIRMGATPGAHIRPAGDDVRQGDLILAAGTVLGARQLGLAANVGLASLPVVRRPVVAVISTGSELRQPGEELGPGQIHDGNSWLLAQAVEELGARAVRVGLVEDSVDAFRGLLDGVTESADLVLTSGGVSQGDYDVVKAALRDLPVDQGGPFWFGPVRMQPGKPQGFGAYAGVPVLTFPGNPVSAYLSFLLFGAPVVRRLAGHPDEEMPTVRARAASRITSVPGRLQLLRGRLTGDEVELLGGPGSHLIAALARANAVIMVPEDVTELAPGDDVDVLRLED